MAAKQVSLSFNILLSFLKHMSIESVMPSHHLILLTPLFLPTIFPSIRVSSNELALHIRWPKRTVVLEKILESPLYKKEIKPVNLKGNQLVTPAVSAEASTEGLQVERMDASTAKVPNHGSSKPTVCSPTHGEAQKD